MCRLALASSALSALLEWVRRVRVLAELARGWCERRLGRWEGSFHDTPEPTWNMGRGEGVWGVDQPTTKHGIHTSMMRRQRVR